MNTKYIFQHEISYKSLILTFGSFQLPVASEVTLIYIGLAIGIGQAILVNQILGKCCIGDHLNLSMHRNAMTNFHNVVYCADLCVLYQLILQRWQLA